MMSQSSTLVPTPRRLVFLVELFQVESNIELLVKKDR